MIELVNVNQKYADFYLSVDRTRFPEVFHYETLEDNRLILKFNLYNGIDTNIAGIQGNIALGMIPLDYDLEGLWEADRPKGTWDWFSVFQFIIKINDNTDNVFSLQIFNVNNSLLDLTPYKVQFDFNLHNYNIIEDFLDGGNFDEIDSHDKYFEIVIIELMKVFKKEFDANLVEKPKDNI
jgi:hypothetical protein